jgi:FAD:protein FMN transferase
MDLQAVVRRRVARFETIRAHIDSVVLAEIDRLSSLFSVYDEHSELCRWRVSAIAGSSATISGELAALLQLSATWQRSSGGAYNPAVGAIYDHWRTAERTGVVPSIGQTDEWAAALGKVPYEVDGCHVHCIGDCTGLSFNSLAKGLIADCAAGMLMAFRTRSVHMVEGVTLNLGGDLRTINRILRVGVEHPTRPYDNEPALATIQVDNVGVATSGSSRRPIQIGAHRLSHIIDPRTCRPVRDGPTSVTVVAADAASADVLATIIAVSGSVPQGVAAATADVNGQLTMSPEFASLVLSD